MLLWPLAAVDTAFDSFLALTGPIGRPLRAGSGKSVLAFLGVVGLLAAVAVSLADWFGWL